MVGESLFCFLQLGKQQGAQVFVVILVVDGGHVVLGRGKHLLEDFLQFGNGVYLDRLLIVVPLNASCNVLLDRLKIKCII